MVSEKVSNVVVYVAYYAEVDSFEEDCWESRYVKSFGNVKENCY